MYVKLTHMIVSAAAIAAAAVLQGCTGMENENPYSDTLNTLIISPVYPEGFGEGPQSGIPVSITETGKGTDYTAVTGSDGKASVKIPDGIYRITLSYSTDGRILNGSADRVRVIGADRELTVPMDMTEPGEIVIIGRDIHVGQLHYPAQQHRPHPVP